MNNKGFTLVELIATIALLAIIMTISFVSINKVIENNKITECENLVKTIESATKEYVSDNRYKNIFANRDNVTIELDSLIDGKYISSPINNPFVSDDNDSNYYLDEDDIKIIVNLNTDYTVKDITVKNGSYDEINCESLEW